MYIFFIYVFSGLLLVTSAQANQNYFDCVKKSKEKKFSDYGADLLCSEGNITTALCADKVMSDLDFNHLGAIMICSRAQSMGPASCAEKALSEDLGFSRRGALFLCGLRGNLDRANCAENGISSGVSHKFVIQQCHPDFDQLRCDKTFTKLKLPDGKCRPE